MSINDVVSIAGIIILGLIGVYFSFKFKKDEEQHKVL